MRASLRAPTVLYSRIGWDNESSSIFVKGNVSSGVIRPSSIYYGIGLRLNKQDGLKTLLLPDNNAAGG